MHALMKTGQRIDFRSNESKLAVFCIGEIAIMGELPGGRLAASHCMVDESSCLRLRAGTGAFCF
jgi:hypothetical protein